jgi:hypothetical protein
MYTALYALYGTNATTQANAITAVGNDRVNRWGPCQTGADGFCGNNEDLNVYSGQSSWVSGGFPVSIQGHTVTAQNGGTWASSAFTPPVTITSATATNPMVLTTSTALFTIPGQNIGIAGAIGCTGLNGVQNVESSSGNSITINFNGTGCAYSPSSGTAGLPNAIWFTSTGTTQPFANAQGDAVFNYAIWRSPTQLYLTDITGVNLVNYSGTQTGSNIGW